MNIPKRRQFPKNQEESPAKYYGKIFDSDFENRNELYISIPLSSGGARRLYSTLPKDEKLLLDTVQGIIIANSRFGEKLYEYGYQNCPTSSLYFPFDTGYFPHWTQVDYCIFSLYYMCGVESEVAITFEQELLSNPLFRADAFHASQKERWEHYQKLHNLFYTYLEKSGKDIWPVSSIAFLPDYSLSLGCSLENLFAQTLGIQRKKLLLNTRHPSYKEVAAYAPWLEMLEEEHSRESDEDTLTLFVDF